MVYYYGWNYSRKIFKFLSGSKVIKVTCLSKPTKLTPGRILLALTVSLSLRSVSIKVSILYLSFPTNPSNFKVWIFLAGDGGRRFTHEIYLIEVSATTTCSGGIREARSLPRVIQSQREDRVSSARQCRCDS